MESFFQLLSQGEDVRAGVRTPSKLMDMQSQHHALFDELEQVAAVLEKNYTDMQVCMILST